MCVGEREGSDEERGKMEEIFFVVAHAHLFHVLQSKRGKRKTRKTEKEERGCGFFFCFYW